MKQEHPFGETNPEGRKALFDIIESIIAEDPVGRGIGTLRKRELLLGGEIEEMAESGKKFLGTEKVYYREKRMSIGELGNAVDDISKASNIYILTGFFIPSSQTIETDGISGACFLSKALDKLGKRVYVLNDPHNKEILKKAFETIQFSPSFVSPNFNNHPSTWIDYNIKSCMISIERPGMGIDGKYRTMRGIEIPAYPLDKIFVEAQQRGDIIKTISCADGLNEIGMGKLSRGIIPNDEKIHSIIPVDDLILGGTADWAVFGLIAALQLATGEYLLPSMDEQERLLKTIVSAGAVDGITGESKLSIDSLPLEEHKRKVTELRFFAYP
jgi:hypothetical protein